MYIKLRLGSHLLGIIKNEEKNSFSPHFFNYDDKKGMKIYILKIILYFTFIAGK